LDHGKRRSANRWSAEAERVDLGNEPPLSADGDHGSLVDRKRVSVQWFSGTILTALFGAALMGGAVFASLDGETNFATVPERVGAALRGAVNVVDRASSRKADRLPPVNEVSAHRHIIRVSTMSRVGNREVVRVRPYVRVTGNLSLTTTDLSANIPPFNPQRMLADTDAPDAPVTAEAPAVEPDAEVSFVTRDLGSLLPRMRVAATVSVDDVLLQVRDAAKWISNDGARFITASIPTGSKLNYAIERNPDPYTGFETRVVPENVTLLPKTTTQTNAANGWHERAIVIKKGESVATVLKELGATADEIKNITATLGPRGRPGAIKEGSKLRILLAPAGIAQRLQPIRIIVVAVEGTIEAVVALSDIGRYVPVDVRMTAREVTENTEAKEDDGRGVRLYQSIYETALRNNIPRAVIDNMIRIYSYDVDFQRKVQPGDSFEVLYAGDDETGIDNRNDVVFASLTVGGETRKFYQFKTADDNVVDYYDETGKSAKKFLVRKPLATDAIMRSPFGFRKHPILGYSKMHTGVDWAAPLGTPIFAAGNGIVETVGWEGGYGKYIRIRHANGYETAYGHLTAYAKGITEGVRVRQGQIIGYVGSTGLSTGPHLHYEIMVNGRFVDPNRIRLPRGRALEGPVLAGFEMERDRIDHMMVHGVSPPRMAQTIRR
jgi:murein DD-endopeptidase MepM/ murein hydrolase activator NlpD